VAGIVDVSGFSGDGGPATSARLSHPTRVAVGHNGEMLIADRDNHRIRRVGPDGKISTIVGTGLAGFGGEGGPATDAFLKFPTDVLPDGANDLLIVDTSNSRVRNVDRDGVITTIARRRHPGSRRRPARHLGTADGRRDRARPRGRPARLRRARPPTLAVDPAAFGLTPPALPQQGDPSVQHRGRRQVPRMRSVALMGRTALPALLTLARGVSLRAIRGAQLSSISLIRPPS
jgi:hypothetical protein